MNSSLNSAGDTHNNRSMAAAGYDLREVKLTMYLLILLFSVTGNTLVILSVIFFQRLKTVPNFFIANLAACDLVTTLSSIPFDLPQEELGYWPYGEFMCKILWPLATFSTTSAVFTLVSISADRYGALVHPLNFRYKITKRKCAFVMCLVYSSAAVAILPYLIFLKHYPPEDSKSLPQCAEEWPDLKYRKSYTVFLFSIQYGIPLMIMSYIYIRLGCLLQENTRRASDMSSEKKPLSPVRKISQLSNTSASNVGQSSLRRRKQQNDKTVKMFFVIVMIFLVFMLPNQILWLLYDFGNSNELVAHIDLVAFICRAFTYTNSVLNAVVYGACNSSFRRAFKAILRCKCGKRYQREMKRSLSIYRGRACSEIGHNKTKSPINSPQRPHNIKCVKKQQDSTETVEGSTNSDASPALPFTIAWKDAPSESQPVGFSATTKKGIHWKSNPNCNDDMKTLYEGSEISHQPDELLDNNCNNENNSFKSTNNNNSIQVLTSRPARETRL